ncbi:hypothetical protein CEXT_11041 [Caerostris extrusa]|uniref:Uncharacterized protein n=1 Tax=Caerostris extrusa TaxID=172846 RepID=A0AAV4MCP9_CAEEX|nr:hypothetical protein CEXT_11041 [Caerostris extrusa]
MQKFPLISLGRKEIKPLSISIIFLSAHKNKTSPIPSKQEHKLYFYWSAKPREVCRWRPLPTRALTRALCPQSSDDFEPKDSPRIVCYTSLTGRRPKKHVSTIPQEGATATVDSSA